MPPAGELHVMSSRASMNGLGMDSPAWYTTYSTALGTFYCSSKVKGVARASASVSRSQYDHGTTPVFAQQNGRGRADTDCTQLSRGVVSSIDVALNAVSVHREPTDRSGLLRLLSIGERDMTAFHWTSTRFCFFSKTSPI